MERLPHETWGARIKRLGVKGGKLLLEGVMGGILDGDSGDSDVDVLDDMERDKNPQKAITAFYGAYISSRNEMLQSMEAFRADSVGTVQAATLCLRAATVAMSDKAVLDNGLKYTWGGGFEFPEGYFKNTHDSDDPVNRALNALDRGNTQAQLYPATRSHAAEIMQAWTLFAFHNEQTNSYSSAAVYPHIHPALQHASGSYAMSLRADFGWEEMGITEVDAHGRSMGLHATLFGLASHASTWPKAQQENIMNQLEQSFLSRLTQQ